MAENKVTVGYWGVAGLGNQIRYLLSYLNVNFEDKLYTEQDQWFKNDKTGLGIPLPNLPYLIDGDFKLSESTAIIRYIPKKFGKPELLGKTVEDEARVNQILGVITDVQNTLSTALRAEGFQDKKAETYEKVSAKLVDLNANVKENYALGYLTIADFRLSDFFYLISSIFPEETKDLKTLATIPATFYEIPEIKKYLATGVRTVFPPFIPINITLPGGN